MDNQSIISDLAIPEHVTALRTFSTCFGSNFETILHACCLKDTSATKVFKPEKGTKNLVHVDLDEEAINHLRQLGLNAHCANVESFDNLPASPDVIILFNSCPDMDALAEKLELWGYFLCTDFHGAARRLKQREDFVHAAAIRYVRPSQGDFVLEDDDAQLVKYWDGQDATLATTAVPSHPDEIPISSGKVNVLHVFQRLHPGAFKT